MVVSSPSTPPPEPPLPAVEARSGRARRARVEGVGLRRWLPAAMTREVLGWWLVTRVGLFVLSVSAPLLFNRGSDYPDVWRAWVQWDVWHLKALAEFGYNNGEPSQAPLAAFFPGFPLLVHVVQLERHRVCRRRDLGLGRGECGRWGVPGAARAVRVSGAARTSGRTRRWSGTALRSACSSPRGTPRRCSVRSLSRPGWLRGRGVGRGPRSSWRWRRRFGSPAFSWRSRWWSSSSPRRSGTGRRRRGCCCPPYR